MSSASAAAVRLPQRSDHHRAAADRRGLRAEPDVDHPGPGRCRHPERRDHLCPALVHHRPARHLHGLRRACRTRRARRPDGGDGQGRDRASRHDPQHHGRRVAATRPPKPRGDREPERRGSGDPRLDPGAGSLRGRAACRRAGDRRHRGRDHPFGHADRQARPGGHRHRHRQPRRPAFPACRPWRKRPAPWIPSASRRKRWRRTSWP